MPPNTYGRVIATGGLRVRNRPSVNAGSITTLPQGYIVKLACRITGEDVDGNDVWYATEHGWVTARYVANVGAPPSTCSPTGFGPYSGKAITTLNVREGPDTSQPITRVLATGEEFIIDCLGLSESILGNEMWYRTEAGDWVSAAWVYDFGELPGMC